jgi:alkyl sulfatase BDS1-like metallo-beta-lactamase superfamily hydrolase
MTTTAADVNRIRLELVASDADLTEAIIAGGAFGGDYSQAVAQNMFNPKSQPAIEDARAKTEILEVCDRTWLVRLPIVNAVVFETDQGLVIVDTGMAPGGPAVLDAVRSVTDASIHTIIYTHAHVDHCMGTWALIEDGPEIVAHVAAEERFDRYVRLRGSVSRYMSQPLEGFPAGPDDWVAPTRTFRDRLSLTVGGEQFDLVHRRGETDDQLYVSVPGRRAVACADYYQGFLPNAGNGKRVQRYIEEWAVALREMVALEPDHLLPAHNDPISGRAEIAEVLTVHAEALEYIVAHTIDGLNDRLRQDEVVDSLELPSHLADHPALHEQYVSPKDISRMVVKQYCGWWDDIPAHWGPPRFDRQAAEIARLAGGVDRLVARARELSVDDPALACQLADWAFFADDADLDAAQAVLDVYRDRIIHSTKNTQEVLVYLDHMVAARIRLMEADRAD